MTKRQNYFEKLKNEDNELNTLYEDTMDSSIPEEIDMNVIIRTINENEFKTATNFTKDEFYIFFRILTLLWHN